MREWASIPKSVCRDVRRVCIETTKEYLKYLSGIKGDVTTIKDVGLLVPFGVKPSEIRQSISIKTPLVEIIEELFTKT